MRTDYCAATEIASANRPWVSAQHERQRGAHEIFPLGLR